MVCWGANNYGQSSPPEGTFVQVSVGLHSCGLRSDGTLTCWGRNDQAQAFTGCTINTTSLPSATVGVYYAGFVSASSPMGPMGLGVISGNFNGSTSASVTHSVRYVAFLPLVKAFAELAPSR